MATVTLYFIRQKSTGHYLPTSSASGLSHTRPEDPAKVQPRVFTSAETARTALGTWLLGKVYQRPGTMMSAQYFEECVDIVPQPERNPGDMEVHLVDVEL